MTDDYPEVTKDRVLEVREKYKPLFRRFPNYAGVGSNIPTNQGERRPGIRVSVTEMVDQDTLASEDRIPSCLEGVPVHIEVVSPAEPA